MKNGMNNIHGGKNLCYTIQVNKIGGFIVEDEKLDENQLLKQTREVFHSYYEGNKEPWFSLLCDMSVYIGSDDPILTGKKEIQNHFSSVTTFLQMQIMDENYQIQHLGPRNCSVYGSMILCDRHREHGAVLRFSLIYGVTHGKAVILQQQNSYEYIQFHTDGTSESIFMNMQTLRFVRRLMLSHPIADRIEVKSGKQTLFINPYLILYVQSDGKYCELCCVDKTVVCNCSIRELARQLPPYFYAIHRSYIVNTYYVLVLRRFEVELVSGTTLPVPEHQYSRVKKDFHKYLHIQE